MGKDRYLTMIDTTSEPKPEYDTDQFVVWSEIGQLGEKEYIQNEEQSNNIRRKS